MYVLCTTCMHCINMYVLLVVFRPFETGIYPAGYYPHPERLWVLYNIHTRTYPELLWVLYDIHTRTRNFCKFCTRATMSGVGVQHSYTYPELLWVMYDFYTLPGTSVSSVGLPYPYLELLCIMYDFHTCTRNFWVLYNRATIPGVRVQYSYTVPGIFVTSVRLLYRTRNFCDFCKAFMPVP